MVCKHKTMQQVSVDFGLCSNLREPFAWLKTRNDGQYPVSNHHTLDPLIITKVVLDVLKDKHGNHVSLSMAEDLISVNTHKPVYKLNSTEVLIINLHQVMDAS